MLVLFLNKKLIKKYLLFIAILSFGTIQAQENFQHQDLISFFKEWRTFEAPPFLDGAPDYTKSRFNRDYKTFKSLQRRLNKMDITGWEMSGLTYLLPVMLVIIKRDLDSRLPILI